MEDRELHVVFGAGQVGAAIARELSARRGRVRVVSRRGRAEVPAGVEVASGDASDPADARQASRGGVVVYGTAQPPYTRWPEEFPPILDGVIEAAAATGARLV